MNENGGERRAYGGRDTWLNLSDRDHLEDLVGDGRIVLKWIFKTIFEERGLV
jgi:hypothetical protein